MKYNLRRTTMCMVDRVSSCFYPAAPLKEQFTVKRFVLPVFNNITNIPYWVVTLLEITWKKSCNNFPIIVSNWSMLIGEPHVSCVTFFSICFTVSSYSLYSILHLSFSIGFSVGRFSIWMWMVKNNGQKKNQCSVSPPIQRNLVEYSEEKDRSNDRVYVKFRLNRMDGKKSVCNIHVVIVWRTCSVCLFVAVINRPCHCICVDVLTHAVCVRIFLFLHCNNSWQFVRENGFSSFNLFAYEIIWTLLHNIYINIDDKRWRCSILICFTHAYLVCNKFKNWKSHFKIILYKYSGCPFFVPISSLHTVSFSL